jgi:prepilin-type N-terminal cleavage/methylation domain-containing protein
MKKKGQSGFTLIELTLVMAISILVAGALIGMFKAHVQMLTLAMKYQFLAQDAPSIGLLLTRTIGNAEDYRIYSSGTTARSSNGTAVLNGPAVKLWMRQPNSTFRLVVVSYETFNSHPGLYVFLTDTGVFTATPNWELAGGQLTNTTFDATTGVLLATLTGSYFDQYLFSAEKK